MIRQSETTTEDARRQRLLAMHRRALAIADKHGLREIRVILLVHRGGDRGTLNCLVRNRMLPGWQFASLLEAADLGLEHQFRTEAEGRPTEALPGTREKIEVLVERVASGCALWQPGDREPSE